MSAGRNDDSGRMRLYEIEADLRGIRSSISRDSARLETAWDTLEELRHRRERLLAREAPAPARRVGYFESLLLVAVAALILVVGVVAGRWDSALAVALASAVTAVALRSVARLGLKRLDADTNRSLDALEQATVRAVQRESRRLGDVSREYSARRQRLLLEARWRDEIAAQLSEPTQAALEAALANPTSDTIAVAVARLNERERKVLSSNLALVMRWYADPSGRIDPFVHKLMLELRIADPESSSEPYS